LEDPIFRQAAMTMIDSFVIAAAITFNIRFLSGSSFTTTLLDIKRYLDKKEDGGGGMKRRTRACISLICAVLLTGRTSLSSVRIKSDQAPGIPLEATAESYTKKYFQARFIGPGTIVRPLHFLCGSKL
jgi:hypothetical protein